MSSSHVVVIDSTARRAVVKVTPSKHLTDVLQEACKKLSLNPNQYGLKNNKKAVDLSRTIRLSGLSSGAKLELVLLSRSPSVVSVALQLPESDTKDAPNVRLVEKFPNSTSLWQILRKFESGVAGSTGPETTKHNFTARGFPRTNDGDGTGAGRLYYQTPVLQVMGRELSSFQDLQKSLGQLGFSSGTTLLRLSFRPTETPLEEAMQEMEQYFKVDTDSTSTSAGAHSGTVSHLESTPNVGPPSDPPTSLATTPSLAENAVSRSPGINNTSETNPQDSTASTTGDVPSPSEQTILGPSQRPISVYAPPSNIIPQAVTQHHNEADYEPTVDHARLHQSRLSQSAKPTRLLSEAELALQADAEKARLTSVKEVEIKIRFPDQSQVVTRFGKADSMADLLAFVRGVLARDDVPFVLGYTSKKGPVTLPTAEPAKRLIQDLGLTGRVLLNFSWADAALAASAEAVLKPEFRQKAQEIKVEEIGPRAADEDTKMAEGPPVAESSAKKAGSKGKGVPKWLKLPGKK